MTTYTYIGGPMKGIITQGLPQPGLEVTALSGTIVLAEPLKPNLANQIVTPVHYQFSNDSFLSDTFWNSNPQIVGCSFYPLCSTRFFMFSTGSFGEIEAWAIFINIQPGELALSLDESMSSVFQPDPNSGQNGLSGDSITAVEANAFLCRSVSDCTYWQASGPAGHWVTGKAVIPPPPPSPTSLDALGCEPGSDIYKTVPLSNSTSVALREDPARGPTVCAVPSSKPDHWYIQLTLDGGTTWYWEPLVNFFLGAGAQ
jgi:hypothetical protein